MRRLTNNLILGYAIVVGTARAITTVIQEARNG